MSKKTLYSHHAIHSEPEQVPAKEKDFGIDTVLAATSGELYNSSISKLKTASANVSRFLIEADW